MPIDPFASPDSPRPRVPLKSEFASDPEMLEIVELFVQEMPGRLEQMHNSWNNNDLQALKRAAHQLKGAGGGYGYPAVSSAAAALEQALKSVLGGQSAAAMDSLRRQFNELSELCRSVTVK